MNRLLIMDRLGELHLDELDLLEQASREYAADGNALRNFEHVAAGLGISREMVLCVYLLKHIDGIAAYIRTGAVQRDTLHGRIMDARLYLGILDAMTAEGGGE